MLLVKKFYTAECLYIKKPVSFVSGSSRDIVPVQSAIHPVVGALVPSTYPSVLINHSSGRKYETRLVFHGAGVSCGLWGSLPSAVPSRGRRGAWGEGVKLVTIGQVDIR